MFNDVTVSPKFKQRKNGLLNVCGNRAVTLSYSKISRPCVIKTLLKEEHGS